MIEGVAIIDRISVLARPGSNPDDEVPFYAPKRTLRVRWWKVLRRDPCAYCGERHKRRDMTVDHIVPKANGGTHGGNVTAACRPCNADKGTMSLLHFLAYRAAVDNWRVLQAADLLRVPRSAP